MQLKLVLCCTAAFASKGTYDKLFVFGDSFVDTGNRDPANATHTAIGRVNQNWTPPYGRTRPGEPAGRFSDGKVLSDVLGTMTIPALSYTSQLRSLFISAKHNLACRSPNSVIWMERCIDDCGNILWQLNTWL